ncbi:GntR family transcriptional regulator [Erythrobacter sp.]|jgi:DNA-binding GntR family transcriptional regulator|uniref:GntR family transcriptional regulator n=1 Tax=Erythrobacter sp. TaxID=1042 RepID=UPI002EACC64B|nr:GntR family transcriptional regulator [Erythrobacter sp.]
MSEASSNAYDVIRRSIMEGDLLAGQRLREADLGRLCKVSRTPIREALRRLESDGIVSITPNSGAVVTTWKPDELPDLFLVRATLEGMAAQFAAQRRSEGDLHALTQLVEAMDEMVTKAGDFPLGDGALARIANINREFHDTVLSAARSRALHDTARRLLDASVMLRSFTDYDRSALERSCAQHRELTEAIAARDPERACAVMRAHILAARGGVLAEE